MMYPSMYVYMYIYIYIYVYHILNASFIDIKLHIFNLIMYSMYVMFKFTTFRLYTCENCKVLGFFYYILGSVFAVNTLLLVLQM